MLKSIGEHKATNRELFAVHLNNARDLSDTIDITSKHFACFLCWDSRDIDSNEIETVAEILLRSGCVYFCTWGSGSARAHDIIDKVIIGKNMEEESVIMTTWHEDESLDEALWFFLNNTLPDDKYIASCRAGVAISIGITLEQRARIDFALTFSREFDSQVLGNDELKKLISLAEGILSESVDRIDGMWDIGRGILVFNDFLKDFGLLVAISDDLDVIPRQAQRQLWDDEAYDRERAKGDEILREYAEEIKPTLKILIARLKQQIPSD